MTQPAPETNKILPDKGNSYSNIVNSSSIIGSAQGVAMLVGMVRVKCIALLIGPVGIGLMATYQATIEMIGTIAGLGIQSSAVRDVVEAIATDDQEKIGRTILTLQRLCWITGGLGFLTVVLFSRQLSQMTFHTPEYTFSIAMLGLTVLFANLQGGQIAVVQGMRRIRDLAKINLFGTIGGSVVSVSLFACLGLQGIVPAIFALSSLQLCISWWFVHKISVPEVKMSWAESIRAAGGMVKLGLVFMWSGFLGTIVSYATRTLIAREIDLVAVGIYMAAFSLSGIFVRFVLGAMGADYYPGLIAISEDSARMRKLVNEQIEIGMLLALPGLLFLLVLSPWVIAIFYSSEFAQATILLRWFAVGCFGMVISYPMGYILLAKGKNRLYASADTFINVLHIVLIWGFLLCVGVEGVAIAYVVLFFIHVLAMLGIGRYLIGFTLSKGVLRLLSVLLPVIVGNLLIGIYCPSLPATIVGVLSTVAVSIFCLHALTVRLGPDHKITRFVKIIIHPRRV